jgi:hypothetical protein
MNAQVFGERVMSQVLWPGHPPDFNPVGFYLWCTLKDKMYVNNPHSLRELKEIIRQEISAIPRQLLHHVPRNIFQGVKPG